MELSLAVLVAALRIATPLILASLGEVISEKSGVINLGIEGIVLLGAFTAFTASYYTNSVWVGMGAAMFVGIVGALLVALLAVTLRLNQHVSGLGVTILLSGVSYFSFRALFGSFGTSVQLSQKLPLLLSFGPVPSQSPLTYLAIVLIPMVYLLLQDTVLGLRIRAVGEYPSAADTVGIKVLATRYTALALGGALMGLAGSFLTLAQLGSFTFGIVAGRGWVAVALVAFGGWNPVRVGVGALLFGFFEALELQLQAIGAVKIPYEIYLMFPYVFTIVAMATVGKSNKAPAALLKPFVKEEV